MCSLWTKLLRAAPLTQVRSHLRVSTDVIYLYQTQVVTRGSRERKTRASPAVVTRRLQLQPRLLQTLQPLAMLPTC